MRADQQRLGEGPHLGGQLAGVRPLLPHLPALVHLPQHVVHQGSHLGGQGLGVGAAQAARGAAEHRPAVIERSGGEGGGGGRRGLVREAA